MDNQTQPEQNNFFSSKALKWTISVIGGLIVIVGVFALGIRVGLHEARFTQSWAENYPKNFGGTQAIVPPPGQQSGIINSHGIVGTILSIDKDGKTLIIKGSDNVEKTVTLETDTTIRQGFSTLQPTDLKANQSIIIIGEPYEQGDNGGQIEAKFIRVLSQQ